MNVGDVVRLRTLRHYPHRESAADKTPGLIHVDWTAPPGKVYVLLVLGVESRYGDDGSTPEDMLGSMGWRFAPDEIPVVKP